MQSGDQLRAGWRHLLRRSISLDSAQGTGQTTSVAPPFSESFDAVVVGGGFFGCSLALMLAGRKRGSRVLLLEREPRLLMRASARNQARVHGGYHYPRSILTGLRSRVNCPRFLGDFSDCIDRSFKHYYAVARRQSHVTARQFELFCSRIEASLQPAPAEVRELFQHDLIERVYQVEEFAFDADKLREALLERLAAARVEVRTGAAVEQVSAGLHVRLASGDEVQAPRVFNCTYASLNQLLDRSGLERIALRHELAELCLVEVPPPLRALAVTVMCGPFFSLMPFPSSSGLHSFSHVRYTPHCAWVEREGQAPLPLPAPPLAGRPSRFPHLQKDAQRYLPLLGQLAYKRSLFEFKTVLPQSEENDSRPILFKPSERLPGLVSVMGGKIDNVYDLPRELELLFAGKAVEAA